MKDVDGATKKRMKKEKKQGKKSATARNCFQYRHTTGRQKENYKKRIIKEIKEGILV